MSENEVSKALQKIARGTGIVFVGTVVSMLLGFLSRAIIARHFSTSEYGIFNLVLTLLSITLVVATLGFQNSLPREVAYYREREPSKVKHILSTALLIVAVNGILWALLLIFGAGAISQSLNEERLTHALRISALALPFWALSATLISISRGFGRVRERVYFQNIIYPATWLVFVVLLILLERPFDSIFWGYVMAQGITFFALFFESYRIGLINMKLSFSPRLGRRLVLFSLPLMFVGILNFLMTWTDTLMLGYYKGSSVVGLYNAASPLARLIPIFLNSAGVIYPPLVMTLYAQGSMKKMGRVYQILTKWIFLMTLPLFAVMFLFPEATISFLFGPKYMSATPALQILALGFMFHTFLGLNGMTLIVIGKPTFNMIGDAFAVVSNIALNIALIPQYGIVGAATATAVSYFVANFFRSYWLYRETKIHPFSWNYMKPLIISFALLGTIKSMNLEVYSIWYALPILIVFLLVYFVLVLLSRSVDKEDVELFLAIERKLGVELKIIKKVLKRFV